MEVNMRCALIFSLLLISTVSLALAQKEPEAGSFRDFKDFSTFPSIVTVEGNVPEDRSCGGTLIGNHVVLTAAQCVLGVENTTRLPRVVLDALNAQRTNRLPETRVTMETVVYPGYTGEIGDGSDFALLRLDHSAAPLETASFHEGDISFKTDLVTIGAAGEAIRIRLASVADPAECENAGMVLDKDSMICMSGEIPCEGDEGGPILDAKTKKLVSVVSMTADCQGDSRHVAVMTLQNPRILGWVRQTLSVMEYSASLNQSPSVIAILESSDNTMMSVPAPEAGENLNDEDGVDEETVYNVLDFL